MHEPIDGSWPDELRFKPGGVTELRGKAQGTDALLEQLPDEVAGRLDREGGVIRFSDQRVGAQVDAQIEVEFGDAA